MNKLYIVKYYGGGYDDNYTTDIFVTDKKSKATKYVTKFNKTLKRWKKYYERYCDIDSYWIKDEYVKKYFKRWNCLRNITKCYWVEIEIR